MALAAMWKARAYCISTNNKTANKYKSACNPKFVCDSVLGSSVFSLPQIVADNIDACSIVAKHDKHDKHYKT